MQKNHSPVTELKNFAFLVPHLPEFEGELQDLLIEIDKLIERKRTEWETELKNLERKLQLKVRENQELQTLISTKESELKEAASRLRLMEHNFPGGSPEEELNAIKSKVDKMRRGYEILQKKYHKQLGTEKEQSSRALCQLEQTNSLLKQELEDLREESQEQVNSWKTLLEEEKSKSEETDKYCQRLQAELKDLNNRIDQERLDNHNLKEIYHSRCQELEAELEQAKRLSQDQVTEMYEAKRKTGEKTKELARLTSELQTAQTDLTLTGNAVHHLEFLVLQHIALVSKSVKQGVDIDFPCRNPITRSSTMSRSELETKIKDIERKIQKCDHEVLEKFSEMRRLESACQTASGTIHRLVEARTQSMRQVASLSAVLNKAVHGMHLLVERVDSVKYLLSEKLSVTRNGISRVQHAFDKVNVLQSVQSLKKVTRAVLDSGVQTLSSEVEVAVQTAPNAQFPSFDLERVQNDWSTQTKQLHSVIMKLTEDRSQLQSRLHHQLGLVERLQKENLALSDLLTNAEQFNRTRITCQNPLLRESRSNRTRNVEVQVDPWPACAPTQSISPFGMRRSLPSPNKPCIASRARLMESTAFTDSQISPVRFHPLSPASEQTDTIGAVECGQPKPSPDTNQTLISSVVLDRPSVEFPTQFEIPINQAPKVLGLNNRPHARGDSMDSISPINSPSEYEDFALPGFRDPNAIKSSPTHSHNGLCTRALDSPVVAQPVGIRRSRSVHVRFPVPATTVYKIDGNSNKLSSNIYPKEKPLYQISTESYDAGDEVALLAPGDPTLPQACSTLRPTPNATKPLCVYTDYENADTNDSSVYDLAAKFLADEKKFSSRLEQKIDAHLEVLKNQFRLDS
ncbi:hypothetical protein FGIG_05806 [Fasciola gigantica]|uniref:Uncharacterized protein n=1 Tax=Fasciola gigantica TaxID=46835 RepID=A0A504Y860_FASGI|nr:hypothetical protein FGIG_05806 [Fasciola gigantica]